MQDIARQIPSGFRQVRVKQFLNALFFCLAFAISCVIAEGQQVVTNGKFTNVYVYVPNSPGETWDQHMRAERGSEGSQFSRKLIDAFTDTLMGSSAASYFDFIHQYWGVNQPQFFGSGIATDSCVQAALNDAKRLNPHEYLIQWDTVRSLANCHASGLDPSPQVTLIFGPEIKVAEIPTPPVRTADDMCTTEQGWHAWGLNTPNFIALPTESKCAPTFEKFTTTFSHEIVETITDPAGFGFGGVGTDPTNPGKNEVGDKCENTSSISLGVYQVTKYWSEKDNVCEPLALPSLPPSAERDWLEASGIPLKRFKTEPLDLTVRVDPRDVGHQAKSLRMIISTGNDNLRGNGDNCDVTINLADGSTISLSNVNQGQSWGDWTTHSFNVPLPSGALSGGDITGVKLHMVRGGFDAFKSPDNWNVQRVQLKATLGPTRVPTPRSLPSTTVTVTVNQVGSRIAMGPRIPGIPAALPVYGMISINGSEFERSPLSQSMLYDLGTVPIQIEVWQDLPDSKGSGNSRDPNNPGGRGVHNAKATLRTLNIDYNLKTHAFMVRGESGAALPGKAGVAFSLPGDSTHPGVAFTITDQPANR